MRYLWIAILTFVCSAMAYGQKSAEVRRLERQRKETLADIEETDKLLRETAQSAKTSLNHLNLLSRKILSRKKVISLLDQEVGAIDKDIADIQGQLKSLQAELEEKKQNYAKSVRGLYQRRTSQDKLLFILSAESFAQSVRRMRYLREFADWQRREADEIIAKREEIARKRAEMEKTRAEKRALLAEQREENTKLEGEEASRKAEVQRLSKKEKELRAALQKKRKQAEALNRQIERQIAEEIARAERERAAKENAGGRRAESKGGYAMNEAERKLSGDFAGNRGRLPYPVAGRHTVVGLFGERPHEELKYVRTNNSGIDIQTAAGTDARAVFDGVVTRVFVVPGYNNSVIVRHGNYLTVYCNLSQVYVKVGDNVSTRQAIGRVFSDPEEGDATILHFQLWKEKTKLDPLPWLE